MSKANVVLTIIDIALVVFIIRALIEHASVPLWIIIPWFAIAIPLVIYKCREFLKGR